ncbi:MAG: U32 family peptidase [Bacteroidales bacterium]|nr:U32 family peptidase [Bacteroidales bacterium]
MPVLELLAPAKNVLMAKTAVNHGADAVYMGGTAFGARQNACNSLSDIQQAVQYAHQYHAKVYVTLNTILYDNELEQARKMAFDLYDIGADALIIQDMSLLSMSLPPIALHASTQMHNADVQKIKHYRQWGLSRVILARELSLEQIRFIHQECDMDLECFVHGALCVCYSGQCYLSYSMGNRSANRGACAQPCRLEYELLDAGAGTVMPPGHYLSLKDMNRKHYIAQMAAAGVRSFKIEGRLKDEYYVANVVSAYRKQLDALLEDMPHLYSKASLGKVNFDFEPDEGKTFNRGFTSYFIRGSREKTANFFTPKSMGKYLGKIDRCTPATFHVDTEASIANGDGLCWVNAQGKLEGMSVNKVQNNHVFKHKDLKVEKGLSVYRNYDIAYLNVLKRERTVRKIPINIAVSESNRQYHITLTDEAGNSSCEVIDLTGMEKAKNESMARNNIVTQLSKSSDSVFETVKVDVSVPELYFIPMSLLNNARRNLFEKHAEKLSECYVRPLPRPKNKDMGLNMHLNYKANVSNKAAKHFYESQGAIVDEMAVECTHNLAGKEVMRTKYCLRYELNACLLSQNAKKLPSSLCLRYKEHVFDLDFDCSRCEMTLRKRQQCD